MYAVFQTGGKQYTGAVGSILEVETLAAEKGSEVVLNEVLFVATDGAPKIGRPLVSGASVVLEIVEQKRGPRLTIFKKLKRHGKRLKKGHRQNLSRVRIKEIRA